MTDNRNSTQNTQTQKLKTKNQVTSENNKAQHTLTSAVNPNDLKVESMSPTDSAKAAPAPEPQLKKVDIVIAGVTYQIYCPIHEEEELRSAVYYINNFALDIKKQAPSLPQENLLVLSCLNLYEQINASKKSDSSRLNESKQNEMLLNKIIQDAQSI